MRDVRMLTIIVRSALLTGNAICVKMRASICPQFTCRIARLTGFNRRQRDDRGRQRSFVKIGCGARKRRHKSDNSPSCDICKCDSSESKHCRTSACYRFCVSYLLFSGRPSRYICNDRRVDGYDWWDLAKLMLFAGQDLTQMLLGVWHPDNYAPVGFLWNRRG